MLSQKVRQLSSSYNLLSRLAVACGVGVLLGVASLWLSPLWTVIALAGGGLMFVALKRPEIALLGILIATSSIVFEDRLPLIPIGIGSLHIPDVFLLASLGLIILRWLVEPDFKIVRTPLDCPLLIFYGVALLSTFIAIFRSSVEAQTGIRAIRIVFYYLTFFIVTNLVREDHQRRFLLRGIFLLANIVAAAMVIQFLLGESVPILPGRVETLRTQGTRYSGVTRILPPGQSLIPVAFIVTSVTLVLDRFRPIDMLRFLQWGLLGLALVLTFSRASWVGTALAVFLLACLVRGQGRRRFMGFGLVVMFLATMILLLVLAQPESQVGQLASSSIKRLSTVIGGNLFMDSSFRWRYAEYEHALPQVVSHPLLGLGLGARYRSFDARLDYEFFDGRAYIHNGHLWILLKTGLLGYGGLLWLSLVFLHRGFKYWRLIPNSQMRGSVLGFTLTYLGLLIGAVANPTFVQWFWTPVIGLMMGLNEAILRDSVPRKIT